MNILLFDMDGVLLEPHGYHRALQETVRLIGRALGFMDVHLTTRHIAAFEAAGVTSEWDSAAICAALLLTHAWSVFPDASLPSEPPLPSVPVHALSPPDFVPFFRQLVDSGLSPLERAEEILLASYQGRRRNAWQKDVLRSLLRTARDPYASLTHRLFQELVLGSQAFSETYSLPPSLDCESYLLKFDRPALSPLAQEKLRDWLSADARYAAIFTNRPSRRLPWAVGAPEAEIGARLAGVSYLSLIGLGELSWVSARHARDREAFLKPSPVHALAALRCALGDDLLDALERAAEVERGKASRSHWAMFDGAQVLVFEDAVKGLQSVRAAKQVLARLGVVISVQYVGIARDPIKREALIREGAMVYSSLEEALFSSEMGFWG